MATSKLEKVKEDFLTCIICTEPYTDPCTLACDHTFCRKCITQYLQTRPECKVSKTIPCAECRQVTKVPDPSKPIEEWCKQIKPSIIIVGLIDTLEEEDDKTETCSTVKEPRSCSLCQKLGETTPATTWCQHCEDALCDRCTKMHRLNSGSRDHELHNLLSEVNVRGRRRIRCQEHKDETVKFHCKDCKKSACQTCCIIHHRACKSVVTIESMKSTIMNMLSEKSKVMNKKLEVKSARLPKLKAKIEDICQEEDQALGQIKSATEKALYKIKLKEKQLIEELKAVTQKDTLQLRADLKTEEIDIQTYKQHHEFINQALQSQSEMDLYHAYMACESGTGEVEDSWSQNPENYVRQYGSIRFVQDADKVHTTLDGLQLGAIDITYEKDLSLVPSAVLYDTIDIKLESDKEKLGYLNICVLADDGGQRIVVSDYTNACLKSFYKKHSKLHYSILPMDHKPFGITAVDEKTVMISLTDLCQIVKVQVIPELILLSAIKTKKRYSSLSVFSPSSSLLAGSVKPVSVDVLSIDGQVLRSISLTNSKEIFPVPVFLTSTFRGVVISDIASHEHNVTYITSAGEILWKYTEDAKFKPGGITTTQKGDILVALSGSNKIIQLTESGEFIRDVLTSDDGLICPFDIHLDRDVLFVCDKTEIKEYIIA